jgi:hypothetical protein
MDILINLFAKLSGWTSSIMEMLPLIGAVGSLLSVGASVLARVSVATSPSGVFQAAAHPTPAEVASASLAIGLIKAYFAHKANAAAIDRHSAMLAEPRNPS